MTELVLLFVISLIGAEAWQRRQQSELAERLIRHYCQNNHWQLISVARSSFGFPLIISHLIRKANTFVFEFSIDGVSKQESELYLVGLHQPIFRDLPETFQTFLTNGDANKPTNTIEGDNNPSHKTNNVIPFPTSRHRH